MNSSFREVLIYANSYGNKEWTERKKCVLPILTSTTLIRLSLPKNVFVTKPSDQLDLFFWHQQAVQHLLLKHCVLSDD